MITGSLNMRFSFWINLLLDLKLNPDRIDVILPAGKIYYFLMKTLSIEKIYVPKIGLADGMVKKIINSKIKF